MSKLPHFLIENSCYFLTSTTYNRKPIFHNDHYAQILCNIIYNLRKRKKISLMGFVIMPEHFHLLIIPAKGIEIPWIMQEIKKGSARLINMERFGRARGRARLPFNPCESVSSQNSKTSSTRNSVSSSTPTLDSESSPTLIRSSGSSQTPLRYSGSSPTSLRYSGSSPTPKKQLSGSGTSPTPVCFTTLGNNPTRYSGLSSTTNRDSRASQTLLRYSGSSSTPKKQLSGSGTSPTPVPNRDSGSSSTPRKVPSLTSRKVWMDEYFDYVIRSEEDLIKHVKYIHNNPIKRGLVETPEKYTWSSANPNFENDLEKVLSGSEI